MAETSSASPAVNGHATTDGSSASATAELRVLVLTPITAIVTELQSRLSSLPAGVRVEVANPHRLDEQVAACHVLFGEPREIHDKLHVRGGAA